VGGAHHPQASQAVLVRAEEVESGEAGFHSQDVGWGARETAGGPPLDLVAEGREFSRPVNIGLESVRAVAEDWKEKRRCHPMAKERGQAHVRGGEPHDGHKSSMGFGQPLGEVWGCGDRGGEPVAQPPDLFLQVKHRPVQVDRGTGDWTSVSLGPLVDKLCFGDGKADTQAGPFGL